VSRISHKLETVTLSVRKCW